MRIACQHLYVLNIRYRTNRIRLQLSFTLEALDVFPFALLRFLALLELGILLLRTSSFVAFLCQFLLHILAFLCFRFYDVLSDLFARARSRDLGPRKERKRRPTFIEISVDVLLVKVCYWLCVADTSSISARGPLSRHGVRVLVTERGAFERARASLQQSDIDRPDQKTTA